MWKPHLQTEHLTIQADHLTKQILLHVHPDQCNKRVQVQLAESDCIELIYTFLTINREFHKEKTNFPD